MTDEIGVSRKQAEKAADDQRREALPPLPPEARRALDEAEARRRAALEATAPTEIGGPSGPEPTRYGDWERKGITSDF